MGKVLVVGSYNLDHVVRTDRIPRPGETVLGSEFFNAHGGKGANQAVAAARLGAKVSFVCRLGSDSAGDAAMATFAAEAIDARHVSRDPKLPTGTAFVILGRDGQNSIVVAPGSNDALSSTCIQEAFEECAKSAVVLAQLETPIDGVSTLLEHSHRQGKITILNPAPARELSDSILRTVSILTPNEAEAESLTGVAVKDQASATKAADILHTRGVKTVIITMGDKGALVSDRLSSMVELLGAPKVNVVDTTAAGDVFSGALAAGLADRLGLRESAIFAVKAASFSVGRLGAQPSIPFRREL